MGYRRETPALLLCKSIVISIQWFQIPHIITFSTIYNLAELFSGARVSQNLSFVPQLICETSHVLLAGVSGGFSPGYSGFRPTYRLILLDMSEKA